MKNRILSLSIVVWSIAVVACVMIPTASPSPSDQNSAESDRTKTPNSQVWHHRPPRLVGPEVTALNFQPGIGGWLPFLHESAIVKRNKEGVWELQPRRIKAGITRIAADIKRAGFLMLDCEGLLDDRKNASLYIEGLRITRQTLADLGINAKVGYFRIPDHSRINKANRFAMTPVLRHMDAVYIMVKGPRDSWDEYLADVVRVAPNHAHVWYMDAYSRKTGQPYTQKRILDTVRLAHGRLTNPQIVFRQEGRHVAQAMKWVTEWLDHEVADDQ